MNKPEKIIKPRTTFLLIVLLCLTRLPIDTPLSLVSVNPVLLADGGVHQHVNPCLAQLALRSAEPPDPGDHRKHVLP